MAFLKFNKSELVNLDYSLKREIILANKAGVYCNTSIVDCNTRRYHGLLAVPLDNVEYQQQMLLLSSLDESIILSDHQFNLAIHRYGSVYEPRGHKYIVDFNADTTPTITYKVGDIVFTKQFLLSVDEDRVFIKYELLESPSKITLNLKPFLAFRNIHSLTHRNPNANTSYVEVPGGVCYQMYSGCPQLNLQLSCPFTYRHNPVWYEGITYSDEYRRGFDCVEDLLVPGVFTLEMKPGESIVVSASVDEKDPKAIKRQYTSNLRKNGTISTWHDLLVRNAQTLIRTRNGKTTITAGHSWLYTGLLRETLSTLPGLTLYATGDCTEFETILDGLIADETERLFHRTTQVEAPLRLVDVLQHYISFANLESRVWKKYGETVKGIIESYAPGHRKEVSLQPNGLLWAQMDRTALTWMNAYIDGNPVTERAGYQVETNAWWYNALCFAIDMEIKYCGSASPFVEKWKPIRDMAKMNFQKMFWNPDWGYLRDYVDASDSHAEVRPNQLIAVYVQNSPLDDEMKDSVMVTLRRELVTKRGIRTLSPRNINYKGVYEGSQIERDLAYHNGSTRPQLLGFYLSSAFRMRGPSFIGRAEYLTEGLYEDVSKHGVGAFSELYDGDPPHEPHGAIASAEATAALLWCEYLINTNKEVLK